jgi:dTDP-glucose pyrophosphorylase
MSDWKRAVIAADATVRTSIETIQNSGFHIALVADEGGKLLGTVTDGDIRRGLLDGYTMDDHAINIANSTPRTELDTLENHALLAQMNKYLVRQLPLVSADGRLTGIAHIDTLTKGVSHPRNTVVLMAGGMGKRLRPLTAATPKPLLRVGDKPLLETILESFVSQGFDHFFISVNYLADSIIEYFGNGSRWGVSIDYLKEETALGTTGALRLLPERPDLPIIVMNGDLVTRINFTDLLRFHHDNNALGTMCVREYDMEVPFGVVDIDGLSIRKIDEKPVHRFFVNAGIYAVSPQALDLIPDEGAFDMTQLFEHIVSRNNVAAAFPIHEYWLDVGRLDDFNRANVDLKNGDPG